MKTTALIFGSLLAISHASVLFTESSVLDLSGAFASPNNFTVSLGNNTFIGSVGQNGNTGATNGSDADYFTLSVPPGASIQSIIINSYSSTASSGGGSFFGYFAGNSFINQSNVTDFAIFNSSSTDIITDVTGSNFLGAGVHSFWLQEIANTTVNYDLSFVVIPEPATLGLTLLGMVGLLGKRNRIQ